jgi:hypothetical protein
MTRNIRNIARLTDSEQLPDNLVRSLIVEADGILSSGPNQSVSRKRGYEGLRMSRMGVAAAFIALFLCGVSVQQSTVNVCAAPSLTNALQDIDARTG